MEAKLKILLLQDPEADAERVQRELSRTGWAVEIYRVEDSDRFRSGLDGFAPDVILANSTTSGGLALEVLRRLQEEGCDTPLIVLSSGGWDEHGLACLRAGAADFLPAAEWANLPQAIDRALSRHAVERCRRESEASLRRTEEQFRLITESSRDLVCLLDLDHHFVYASPSFESILSRPAPTLIGTGCRELVHPEDAPSFLRALEDALFFREGRHVELRFRRGREQWVHLEASITFIFDGAGRPQRALVAARDTSDRRRAEKEIRKLAAFPRFNPNPVFEFAADGSLTYFNDAALEMARSLKKTHPQSILPLTSATIVKLCLSTGQKKLHHDTNFGGRILSWSFFPVTAHQLVHCYAEDVTEQFNLEAQLRQAQKMDSVGQLAAGVAHDFNNLLTVIQGHAGLISGDESLPPKLADYTHQIVLAAERAANLTRQLLLFSRKQLLQPQLLNLNDVTQNLSKMVKTLVGESCGKKRRCIAH